MAEKIFFRLRWGIRFLTQWRKDAKKTLEMSQVWPAGKTIHTLDVLCMKSMA